MLLFMFFCWFFLKDQLTESKPNQLFQIFHKKQKVPLYHIQACEVWNQAEMCQKVKGTEKRDLQDVILQLYSNGQQ